MPNRKKRTPAFEVVVGVDKDASEGQPARRWEPGEALEGHEFSAEVLANWLELGVIKPYSKEVEDGR